MSFADILAFAVVAGLLVISPGPNGVLIAKTVPASGRSPGFANVAGFVTAFYLHGALSVFGISVILVNSARLFTVVKALGAAYLIYLGLRALMDAWNGADTARRFEGRREKRTLLLAYTEGFLTNVLNPKVAIFYLAAFPQFIPRSAFSAEWSFLLVTVHSGINALWFGLMVLMFERLTAATRSNRFRRWVKGITGIVLVGFGARLAAFQR